MYFSATPPLRLKSTQDGYKRGDAEERSFAGGGKILVPSERIYWSTDQSSLN
jgi:hypothetical protein